MTTTTGGGGTTTTTGTGSNQIIQANGWTLVGDGTGNAHLTVQNGVPTSWGGGTLYDPQGHVVTMGQPTQSTSRNECWVVAILHVATAPKWCRFNN